MLLSRQRHPPIICTTYSADLFNMDMLPKEDRMLPSAVYMYFQKGLKWEYELGGKRVQVSYFKQAVCGCVWYIMLLRRL